MGISLRLVFHLSFSDVRGQFSKSQEKYIPCPSLSQNLSTFPGREMLIKGSVYVVQAVQLWGSHDEWGRHISYELCSTGAPLLIWKKIILLLVDSLNSEITNFG